MHFPGTPTKTNVDTLIGAGLPQGRLTLAVATPRGEDALATWLDQLLYNVHSAHIGPLNKHLHGSESPMACVGDLMRDILSQRRPPLIVTCLPWDPDRFGHIWLEGVLKTISHTPVAWLTYVSQDVLEASPARMPFRVLSSLTLLFDVGPFDVNADVPAERAFVRVQKNTILPTQGHSTVLD